MVERLAFMLRYESVHGLDARDAHVDRQVVVYRVGAHLGTCDVPCVNGSGYHGSVIVNRFFKNGCPDHKPGIDGFLYDN